MKIKVILTGGTVGSEKVNGIVKNNKDSNIASMWKEKFNSNIDFDVVNLYSILSENIKIKNIEMLFAELIKDYSDYKGIIITHGSDTLSYTSAFVSIKFLLYLQVQIKSLVTLQVMALVTLQPLLNL